MKLGFSFLKLVASLGWEVAVSVGSEPFGEGRGYWWTGIDRLRFWESTRRVVSERWEAFDAQYATLDKWGQWTYIRRLSRVLSTKSTTNGPSVIYGMWGGYALPVQVWLRLNQEHHSFNQITARYAFFITSSFIILKEFSKARLLFTPWGFRAHPRKKSHSPNSSFYQRSKEGILSQAILIFYLYQSSSSSNYASAFTSFLLTRDSCARRTVKQSSCGKEIAFATFKLKTSSNYCIYSIR